MLVFPRMRVVLVLLWVAVAAFAVAAPAALVAQRDPYDLPEPKPQDRIIATFTAEVVNRGARQVRFRWTLQEDDQDQDITCTLDAESDAILEESIEDCEETSEVLHSYEDRGTYRAVLIARSRAGGSDRAVTTVTID